MTKTIIKETFIILLLCVVIALILAIIFYDYIPTNKVIPEVISYSMPEELSEIKNELSNTFTENDEKVVLTYEITEEDLMGYKQTKIYDAGKANPFEVYVEEKQEDVEQTQEGTENEGTSNNEQEDKKQKNSTGTIFETGNTK